MKKLRAILILFVFIGYRAGQAIAFFSTPFDLLDIQVQKPSVIHHSDATIVSPLVLESTIFTPAALKSANGVVVRIPEQDIQIQDMYGDSSFAAIDDFIIKKKSDIEYVIGDERSHLEFSRPVQIILPTDAAEGSLVSILVQHEGDGSYGNRGLTTNPDATCQAGLSSDESNTVIVSDGKVSFYTCGASTFLVSVGSSAFVTTRKTDNPGTSSGNKITIPTIGTGYNYTVRWEQTTDSSNSGTISGLTTGTTITFPLTGTYQIAITGQFPRIYFNNGGDRQKILSIDQRGTGAWTSMESAFYGCNNLSVQAVDSPNLINVTDMSNMFRDATTFNQNINSWNVSNVTNMSSMFYGAASFNQPLSGRNVSQVTNMQYMFVYATNFNQDIGMWNVSNVTNMSAMFGVTKFNQNIGSWNVGNVTNMFGMFANATDFNQNIGAWDVSKVTDMGTMFAGASSFNQNINSWNVGNVTSMSSPYGGMFEGATSFNQNISSWNVSKVINMSNMFSGVTLSRIYYDALLSGWSTQLLKNNVSFHAGNSKYCVGSGARASIISTYNWTISDGGLDCSPIPSSGDFVITIKTNNTGTSASNQFTIPTIGAGYNYTVSRGDGTYTTGVLGSITRTYAVSGTYQIRISGVFPRIYFNNGGDRQKLISIDQWGSGIWNNMSRAFYGCVNLSGQAIDSPNLTGVTDLSLMFRGATSFNQNITSWNTSKVTNMSQMFYQATSFNQNIGSWNTSKVINMSQMFYQATSFNQNIGNWNVAAVTTMTQMFFGATLSTTNYDALLTGWAAQILKTNVQFHAGNSIYCLAQSARTNIINTYGWTITDMGHGCSINPTTPSSGDFVITIKTDYPGVSASNQFTIPTDPGSIYSYTVDRGDGSYTSQSGNATHAYATSGTYQIRISGQFPRVYFNNGGDRQKLISVDQWGSGIWNNMSRAFYGCVNLSGQAVDVPNLTNVNDMSFMFAGATSFNQSLSGWDTSAVTSMSAMFQGATSFNQDINNRNTSNVTAMNSMFRGAASFNKLINNRDVSSVVDMGGMFAYTTNFNQALSGWDTSAVTSMMNMFYNATAFDQDLFMIDTSQVGSMMGMFRGAVSFNKPISNRDTSSVISMESMFAGATSFNQSLSGWNTSAVTSMVNMFAGATSFNQSIEDRNTINVQSMAYMFAGATSFNQSINNRDVSFVQDMTKMFQGATSFNQPLDSWNTTGLVYVNAMFQGATSFNQSINSWNVDNVTDMRWMFYQATNFNQPINSWNVSNVTSMRAMFAEATSFNQPLNNWDVSSITDMSVMFGRASRFDQDLSSRNMSNVMYVGNLFKNSGLSTASYDAILKGWSTQALQYNLSFDASPTKYCFGSGARANIISTRNWTIIDGGYDCGVVTPTIIAPSSGSTTTASPVVVYGTGYAGAQIVLTQGASTQTGVISNAGYWSFNLVGLANGTYTVSVVASTGGITSPAVSTSFVVDRGFVCVTAPDGVYLQNTTVRNYGQSLILQSDYFTVQDPVGSSSGYYTTIVASSLTGSHGGVIDVSNLSWKATPIQTLSGTANPNVTLGLSTSGYVSAGASVTFIQRIPDTGGVAGEYGSKLDIQITIPAYQSPDIYTGQITYTLYEN